MADIDRYVKNYVRAYGLSDYRETRLRAAINDGMYTFDGHGNLHFNDGWVPKPPSTIRWIANMLRLF
jgi:hypothetical protein